MGTRELIARTLADRFIERGNARVTGSVHASYDDMPGSYRNDFLADADAVVAVLAGWQPIETAPRDGTELLGYREDCGVLLMRWTCLGEFLTDAELEPYSEDATYAEDWFYADFINGGRLEDQEAPTHWMPLPATPSTSA